MNVFSCKGVAQVESIDSRVRDRMRFLLTEYPLLNATMIRTVYYDPKFDVQEVLRLLVEDDVICVVPPPVGVPTAWRYCLPEHRSVLTPIINLPPLRQRKQTIAQLLERSLSEYPVLPLHLLVLTLHMKAERFRPTLHQLIELQIVGIIPARDGRTKERYYLTRFAPLLDTLFKMHKEKAS